MLRFIEEIARDAIWLQLIAVLCLTPWCLRALWREMSGRRSELVVAGGLVVVGFVLRWVLPEHAFVHENHHAFGFAPSIDYRNASSHGLPSSTLALAVSLWTVTRVPDIDFLMHAVLSALAVGGAYATVRQVTGSRVGATTAAVLLMLQPLAIFLAPTEEYLVSATGYALLGLPAVLFGVRRKDPWSTLLGVVLICLAASTRDIVLPVSTFAVLGWLAVRPSGKVTRDEWLLIFGVPFVMLLPRTILLLSASRGHETGFMGVPHLIFIDGTVMAQWAGWTDPWIPLWLTLLALVSIGLTCRWSFRKDRTALFALILPWVVAHLAAGVVVSGSFPFFLRHQALAMALFVLPIGVVAARVGERFERRRAFSSWSLPVAAATASAAWLVIHPEAVRPQLPSAQEYNFLAEVLPTLPEQAVAVTLPETDGIFHVSGIFLQNWQPQWRIERLDELEARRQNPGDKPTYFVVDRRCFQYTPCKFTQRACSELLPEAQATMAQTPWGWVIPECKRVLDAGPWTEVARRRVEPAPWLLQRVKDLEPWARNGIQLDMAPLTVGVDVAVLRWDGKPAAQPSVEAR